ncbi:MAG: nuclear transport factor 2 family protein [Bryobacterales bacterium]|nr:nuclear transport factor 2 family protein [Bryobacterales bacterium]
MIADWQPVREWHRAVNHRDFEALRAVVAEDIEMRGPKGAETGAGTLIEWVERSGIQLVANAYHPVSESAVIVEQDASWPGSALMRVATLFRLKDDRITYAERFTSLDAARDALK